MAYLDPTTIQATDPGSVLTAAWCDQVRDNGEFLIDPPACSIKETTAQAVATGTSTALTSNEENYDNDSMHSTTVNTTRLTVQTAGRYLVGCAVEYAINATGSRATAFRINGVATDYAISVVPGIAADPVRVSGFRSLVLAAGDYVELFVNQNSGGNLNVTMLEFAAMFLTR